MPRRMVVAALAALLTASACGETPEPDSSPTPPPETEAPLITPAPPETPSPPVPGTEPGEPVEYGAFRHQSLGQECGVTEAYDISGLPVPTDDTYCLVHLEVTNISDRPQEFAGAQWMRGWDGETAYDTKPELWGSVSLNPGLSSGVLLYFEVPAGTELTHLELYREDSQICYPGLGDECEKMPIE